MEKMDASEAARIVIKRVSELESEDVVKKILGYLYLHDFPEEAMIRHALGPDAMIHELIHKAKTVYTLLAESVPDMVMPLPAVHTPRLRMGPRYGYHFGFEDPHANSGPSSCPLGYYSDETLAFRNLGIRGSRHSVDYPVKICHYFRKGYCKHGMNCRFYHDVDMFSEGPSRMYTVEDQVVSSSSLEKLEFEIIELLKSRRGSPVSIASLPMLYSEKYGKSLQAEGYLTESQRHGKAGYSLTKLLARLKNSIRLIDRPHGQHAVILAEDAPKYFDMRGEKKDRQLYMTFPADSRFTEEDVYEYFSSFGPVEDVRIPAQQDRMFGFVTFERAETVKIILSLSKNNAHYICDDRIMVKPYKERSKLADKKYADKPEFSSFHGSKPIDIIGPRHQSIWECSSMEEQHALHTEAMSLSQLQLSCSPMSSQPCLSYSMDQFNVPEDHDMFPSAERYHEMLNVFNHGSARDDQPDLHPINCGDQDGSTHEGVNLPDSPFAVR